MKVRHCPSMTSGYKAGHCGDSSACISHPRPTTPSLDLRTDDDAIPSSQSHGLEDMHLLYNRRASDTGIKDGLERCRALALAMSVAQDLPVHTTVRFSTSPTALVCHPLLVRMHTRDDESGQSTVLLNPPIQVPIPGLGCYNYIACELESEPAFRLSLAEAFDLRISTRAQITEWMRSKGFQKEEGPCYFVDTRSLRMYGVHTITSRREQAHIVIALFTRRRIPRARHASALAHANEIYRVCVEQYAMSPTTIIINAYFKGAAQGGGTDVSGISRAHEA